MDDAHSAVVDDPSKAGPAPDRDHQVDPWVPPRIQRVTEVRILCMTNQGQRALLCNMLGSAQRAGLDLSRAEIVVEEGEGSAALPFGSPEFCRLTSRKLELIHDRLGKAETPILWVDNDVYFFENPLGELFGYPADFVMQDDTNMACTGFWWLRPNDRTRRDVSAMIEMTERGEGVNDQLAFAALRESGRMESSLHLLSRERYPNGLTYFERRLKLRARVVHNNWLTETAAKVRRFEENGLWRPDPSILEGLRAVKN